MKKNPFLTMIGISIGVLIFFPIIWGDRDDGLWKFVYNFQTLITGFFAVFAASVTVHEMRKATAAQDKRQAELIEHDLRNERKVAQQAIYSNLQDFNYNKARLEHFNKEIKNILHQYSQLPRGIEDQRGDFIVDFFCSLEWEVNALTCQRLQEHFSLPQIENVLPLLTPQGLAAYQQVTGFCKDLAVLIDNLHIHLKNENIGILEAYLLKFVRIFSQMVGSLTEWQNSMSELRERYRIEPTLKV